MNIFLPIVTSFLLTVITMPFFIQYFNRKKLGQTTREEGPLWHEVKTGTPTMGGTVFILAILVTMLIFGMIQVGLNGQFWMIWLAFILYAGIGFIDDFISIFKKQNEGLTAKQKFLTQILFGIVITLAASITNQTLVIPFFGFQITNIVLVGIFVFIWITGFSNAVNLTDGLDGLATGLNIIAYGAYYFLAARENNQTVATVSLIVVGALIGFLIFNRKPAKIFMGDVGSLALGAGLAVISSILNNPWSLLVIGFVFVVETVSVILQVLSFKIRGKRIFKMAPIHHHFEMLGWSESKVVYIFWFVGLICAAIALFIF
ncbi:phospho-N-acetylmuramoyl-pentapeptide-transferase [Aerococcaceae bacterium WGS1372]